MPISKASLRVVAIGGALAVVVDVRAGLVPAGNAPVAQVAPAAHAAMIADLGPVVEIATTADRAEDPAPADSAVREDHRSATVIANSVLRKSPSGRWCVWKFCPSP